MAPHVHKLESHIRDGKAGFFERLKTMSLERKQDRSSKFIKNGDNHILRDVELICEQWVRWFYTLLNTKSPKLDPGTAEDFDQWPVNTPRRVQPTMQLTNTTQSPADGKAVRPYDSR